MRPQVGQRIAAPFLSAPAEVKTFEPRAGYYRLEVVLDDGHRTFRSLSITDDQLAQIEVLEPGGAQLSGGISAEDFYYFIEAHRIRLAYQFDPQLAVSVSQVDPLPHQIEAVYHYALESPRIRFLIADDAGAGRCMDVELNTTDFLSPRMMARPAVTVPTISLDQGQSNSRVHDLYQMPARSLDCRLHREGDPL